MTNDYKYNSEHGAGITPTPTLDKETKKITQSHENDREVIAAHAGVNSGDVSVSGKTQENPQSFLHRDKVFSSVGEAVMKHVAEIGLAV